MEALRMKLQYDTPLKKKKLMNPLAEKETGTLMKKTGLLSLSLLSFKLLKLSFSKIQTNLCYMSKC